MSPNMRTKLERNIEYHAAMADYHQGELDKKAKAAPPPTGSGSQQATASASPPKPDADQTLVDTHKEVVKQLQDLLAQEPVIPAIVQAGQTRPVYRNMSGDLKPSAGVFH